MNLSLNLFLKAESVLVAQIVGYLTSSVSRLNKVVTFWQGHSCKYYVLTWRYLYRPRRTWWRACRPPGCWGRWWLPGRRRSWSGLGRCSQCTAADKTLVSHCTGLLPAAVGIIRLPGNDFIMIWLRRWCHPFIICELSYRTVWWNLSICLSLNYNVDWSQIAVETPSYKSLPLLVLQSIC